MRDLVIIGAGPAGITAGIYAVRKNMDTVVVSRDIGGQTLDSPEIENYLGYSHISGEELVDKFREHLESFDDLELLETGVESIEKQDGGFRVTLEDGDPLDARIVIVASGRNPRRLGAPGEEDFTGKGVMYCATCDAPLFKNKNTAVVGGGNSGYTAAIQLIKVATKVTIIEVEDSVRADEIFQDQVNSADNAEVLTNTKIKEFSGDKLLKQATIENTETGEEKTLDVEGVFVEIGSVPSIDFLGDLLERNEAGEIIVGCDCSTSEQGVFAAGDVTDVPEKQIIVAAGQGATAALSAYRHHIRS